MPKSNSESRNQRIEEILARKRKEDQIQPDIPTSEQKPASPPTPPQQPAAYPPQPMNLRAPYAPESPPAVVTGRITGNETFDASQGKTGDEDVVGITKEELSFLLKKIADLDTSQKTAEDEIKIPPKIIPEESRISRHSIETDRAQTGWRGFLARLGLPIRKGKKELLQDSWLRQIQRPIDGGKIIGVLSFKGGVGKTTVAVSVGTAIHIESGNPVSVVDIDPNGTLKMRAVDKQPSDVRTLAERLRSGTKALNAYAAKTFEKVDLYGSKDHLSDGELSQEDVHEVLTAMRYEYPVTVVDMPIYSQNNEAILAAARIVDCLIIVIPPVEESLIAIPQVKDALRVIDAENLTRRLVFAFNQHDGYSATDGVDIEESATRLIDEGYNVVEIPYDTGLRNINRFAFENIRSSTRWQFVQLSAAALASAR